MVLRAITKEGRIAERIIVPFDEFRQVNAARELGLQQGVMWLLATSSSLRKTIRDAR
jgi:hypothetical protein